MAPGDGPLVEAALGTRLPRRLAQPVEGQPHCQHAEEHESPHERPVEAGALHGVVLEVRAPVGSQLDLGAGLGRPVRGAEDVDDPCHEGDDCDRQTDLLLGGDCEDQGQPADASPLQWGPSAS